VRQFDAPASGNPSPPGAAPGLRKPNSTKFDYRGKVKRPFQILAGGYQIMFRNGKWTQITASAAKQRALKHEDRRQHRSQVRKVRPDRRKRSKAHPK